MTDPTGTPPRGPSRRTVLLGAAGLGIAAGGAASAGILLSRDSGARTAPSTVSSHTSVPRSTPPSTTVQSLLAERPFRVAHRGGSDDWPEMSAYAYRRSVAHGYRALEFSAARSADGVWFGLHDATLDRTSGTSGFVAAEHSWAEISAHRITAAGTMDPAQPTRPYLSLDEFLASFGSTEVLFIDPKAAAAHHYPALIRRIQAALPDAADRVVAKSPGTNVKWARLANAAGFTTWGFYYEADVASGALERTGTAWSLLGMDLSASDVAWGAVRRFGRPVIAHILHTADDNRRAEQLGAVGEIVADVRAIPS